MTYNESEAYGMAVTKRILAAVMTALMLLTLAGCKSENDRRAREAREAHEAAEEARQEMLNAWEQYYTLKDLLGK